MDLKLPIDPEELTLDLLNAVIGQQVPGAALSRFTLLESHVWGGGQASSAGRMVIDPVYTPASPAGLPRHIVVKVARIDPEDTPLRSQSRGSLYSNEVNIYTRFNPAAFLEAPVTLGGAYDPVTHRFMLLLEDLRDRDASFPNVLVPTSVERMRSLLDQLAILHARYWNSPELGGSLAWMERHTSGRLYDTFNNPLSGPAAVKHQIATVPFKREMVERLGTTADRLFADFQRLQLHQARLPQTVCHGDTHIANTYSLPGDKGGLLDWQLTSQGFALHDVSYLMATGLSVAQRRSHERELLAYYREQLRAHGLQDAPSLDLLWDEYRRAMLWGLYIGWLITPVINYGWEITVQNHLRMLSAFEDLETQKLLDAIA